MEDYEKKYKDTLAKAREIHRNEAEKRFDMEWLFPELKESEDERIRKEMITAFSRLEEDSTLCGVAYNYKKWIAWLEKQGEKKSSDEVLKIRQEVYQSGYNDGYKHGIEDVEQGEHKPFDSAKTCKDEQSDLTNFTEFEKVLADVCRGWIGEEIGWKDYIIKNSLPLLEIAKRQLLQQGELIQPVF